MKSGNFSYQHLLKTTSIFGSIQIFNLIISLVRSKFISAFLGAEGVGLFGLFQVIVSLIGSFFGMGLEPASVKIISEYDENHHKQEITKKITIIRRLTIMSGFIGAFVTILASSYISKITFGNGDFTFSIILIALAALFNLSISSEISLLQGLQKYKLLSKANLISNSVAFIISLLLYYFFEIQGIAYAVISSSIITFFIVRYFTKSLNFPSQKMSTYEVLAHGKGLINLGFSLALMNILSILTLYFLQIFIGKNYGIEQLGFYNAGNSILNNYVSVIFIIMAVDYYPRLSKIAGDKSLIQKIICEQTVFVLLILLPIIALFLLFLPNIVVVLYTEKFKLIESFLGWGILGIMIKGLSWCMGYLILAKGDRKIIITNAIVFNSLFLIIHIIGYKMWGTEGLGISFLVYYFIHFWGILWICHVKYGFKYNNEVYSVLFVVVFLCLCLFLSYIAKNNYFLVVLTALSILYSFYELNKRIAFAKLLNKNKP